MSTVYTTSRTSKYGSLISPSRDRNEPVYNWHAFRHSYSKKLVEELVKEFKLSQNSWVLDPFSGGGTTLLACKELGINSKGFDILPFSVFLSNVKTRTYKSEELQRELKIFLRRGAGKSPKGASLPDIGIVDKAFSKETQRELLNIRYKIESTQSPEVRDFFMLALLSILESVSNTSKAGGFLRIQNKHIVTKDIYPIFLSKLETMIDDVEKFNTSQKFKGAITNAEVSDSRKLITNRKFDAIITSPPYPNRHDYTRIYGLELIFNFVRDNDELKKIRYDTLRSHVEARKCFDALNYKQPLIIKSIVTRVKKAGANNSKVTEMIEGYFEDMFLSLCQMQKCLKKGGQIALVVSNVRFSGVSVPVDQILAEIGEQAGLSTQAVFTARYRGNSAQQMKKFKRKPTRESVVIWKNK